MFKNSTIQKLRNKWLIISPHLHEKAKRLWASSEAIELGKFGITNVARATGISRTMIYRGINDIKKGKNSSKNIREEGGGRKKIAEKKPDLIKTLETILEKLTLGNPESAIQWTSSSVNEIAKELKNRGYKISDRSVNRLLHDFNYSLQANRKTLEKSSHPDRNKQIEYINKKIKKFQKRNIPIISVDTKKKELIGNFKNNGQEWRSKKNPRKVNSHDFPEKDKGKAIPYGVYDITNNKGWVSVSISHDTAELAVSTIQKWWKKIGYTFYPKTKDLFILADCGGSNGYRIKLWKWELQKLVNKLKFNIHISHFPPGTSKWNKIEHKMFNFISLNWKGKPLKSLQFIVRLIGKTKTKKGLEIFSAIDRKNYKIGKEISKDQMSSINLKKHKFHGEWNYSIRPII